MDRPIKEKTKKKLLQVSESISKYSEKGLLNAIDYRRGPKGESEQFDENSHNVLELLLLLNFEINCLFNDMISSDTRLGPNLYARHILLIIHESTLTLRDLLANQFKKDSELMFKSLDTDDLKRIHSKICKIHDKSTKEFKKVRNGITAHKDKNAETRIRLIEESDVQKITNLALEFFPIILDLQHSLDEYLEKIKSKI